MRNYDAVIFDLGLTLIYSPRIKPIKKIFKKMGKNIDEVDIQKALAFADNHFMKNYPGELGKNPKEFYKDYLNVVYGYLRLDLSVHDFYDFLFKLHPPRKEWILYEETSEVLKKLKAMNIKLGIISNWDLTARDILRENKIIKYFDDILISAEEGVEKPNSKLFIKSINKLNVEPEKALYVGDNYYDDVIGANSVGIKTLLIKRNSSTKEFGKGDFEVIGSLKEVFDFL